MNLLALPLERDQIFSIKRRFPGFSGKAGTRLQKFQKPPVLRPWVLKSRGTLE